MGDEHLVLSECRGDPNVGFHGVATDSFAVVAPGFKRADVLEVDSIVQDTRISNTDLVGLFASANSQGIMVPDITSEHEKSFLKENGVNVRVLETEQTALGNMMLVNDSGCLISKQLEDVRKEISDFFGVPVKVGTLGGTDIVGSAGVVTNSGLLVHREASEEELRFAEELFGVEGDIGTVNFGSPFVGAGTVANSNGVIAGNDTTGPETARMEKGLGFLD